MKIKKMVSVIAALGMTISMLAGCGTSTADNSVSNNSANSTNSSNSTDNTNNIDSTDVSEDAQSMGKVLVVYYSASGNTKSVAEMVADETGADLFEITPVEPYTSDDLNWTDDDSRVSKEHDDESLRDVELTQVTPDNWDSYDTVLLGYPIWWGIAAWPVDNFVKGNDFSGKTVIPFCTSASSGLGDSGNLLEEMAGTGNWQEGQRFRSGASDFDVQEWVGTLGLSK